MCEPDGCIECNAPAEDIVELDKETVGANIGKRRWCCGHCDAVWYEGELT
jgi:hypothetical protein